MDFSFGDTLIHIDKTVALVIAFIPIFVIMQLPIFFKFVNWLKKKGDSKLKTEPENENRKRN